METITIPKAEYKKLVSRAKAYDKIAGSIFENAIKDPVQEIVPDFKRANLYSNKTQSSKEME